MPLLYAPAQAQDVPECVQLRGQTRQNAISVDQLRAYGITAEGWAEDVRCGALVGQVCRAGGRLAGYCFGWRHSGEIAVLALHPQFEAQGIGRRLLDQVVHALWQNGHARLFLGCSTDPDSRSHGFYRHLGWQSTGTLDAHGDEVLVLTRA